MNRGSERTEVKNGSIASVRPSRHPAASTLEFVQRGWPVTLERIYGRILHEHGGPVRAVSQTPAVGRKELVHDLSRAGGYPPTLKMIGVGELDRVRRGMEEPLGRALEQRGDMVGCIRRTGKRADLARVSRTSMLFGVFSAAARDSGRSPTAAEPVASPGTPAESAAGYRWASAPPLP